MVATRLYLVRHGETLWNKEFRYQGHSDVALTEEGREQARLLAKKLIKEEFQAFYASDLSRARETAEIIAKPHKLEVQVLPELRETKFGAWEGLTYPQLQEQYAEVLNKWIADPLNTTLPEGESLRDLINRVSDGIQKLIHKHKGEKILVAAHGGVNRVILALALAMDVAEYWRIRQDNTALNIIDYYDGKEIVALMNDVGHLKR